MRCVKLNENNGLKLSPVFTHLSARYVGASSGEFVTVTDPSMGEVVTSRVANAGQSELRCAVAAAEAAFKPNSPWRTMTTMKRAQKMWKAAELLEQEVHLHNTSLLEARSFGKPYSLHRANDVKVAADYFRYFAGWCDKIPGDNQLREGGQTRLVRREPLGVVAAIMAWNSPIASIGMKLGPSLAAGNCIILKPSEKTPLGTLYPGRIFVEAGFPAGVIQVLTGDDKLGSLMAHPPKIRKIRFTGSVGTGRKIQEAAARSNLKRVTIELGGRSPIIVCKDANLENAAFWTSVTITVNTGQVCIAGSRIYVHEDVVDQFRTLYYAKLGEMARGRGLPTDPTTTYGTVADKAQFNRIKFMIDDGRKKATVAYEGDFGSSGGLYIPPTVFENPTATARVYKEEIFGPVSVMKTFLTEEEVIAMANDSEYGLMASVFTVDLDCAARLSEALEAGTVCTNTSLAISFKTPFGGQKQSGYGSEGGLESVLAYTQIKTVVQQLV